MVPFDQFEGNEVEKEVLRSAINKQKNKIIAKLIYLGTLKGPTKNAHEMSHT